MTVFLLTPTLAGHDGLSCLSRQLVHALAAGATRLHALTLDNGSSREYRWPDHVEISDARGSRPEFLWRTMQMQRKGATALVVVVHAHLLPAAWPFLRRGASLLPILVGIEAWRPLTWTQKRMLARAVRALAISHHTKREFQRANPDVSLTIDVCWPPTPPLPAPAPTSPIASRRSALIVGRMCAEERYKGHDVLIDVWPEVSQRVPDAHLVVAGTGDDAARLRSRVDDRGLAQTIEFVGRQTPDALAALYRDCAFLVMPSRHEGFGLVFLEAMSAGRACLGAPGAAQEIIVHGETGLIADPARPHDVCEAIVTLFQQPDLASRFGDAGRRRARDVFSPERFTRGVLDIVGGIAPAGRATAC